MSKRRTRREILVALYIFFSKRRRAEKERGVLEKEREREREREREKWRKHWGFPRFRNDANFADEKRKTGGGFWLVGFIGKIRPKRPSRNEPLIGWAPGSMTSLGCLRFLSRKYVLVESWIEFHSFFASSVNGTIDVIIDLVSCGRTLIGNEYLHPLYLSQHRITNNGAGDWQILWQHPCWTA